MLIYIQPFRAAHDLKAYDHRSPSSSRGSRIFFTIFAQPWFRSLSKQTHEVTPLRAVAVGRAYLFETFASARNSKLNLFRNYHVQLSRWFFASSASAVESAKTNGSEGEIRRSENSDLDGDSRNLKLWNVTEHGTFAELQILNMFRALC
jgi:hypothetical protein